MFKLANLTFRCLHDRVSKYILRDLHRVASVEVSAEVFRD
jgi:hypothetical protein